MTMFRTLTSTMAGLILTAGLTAAHAADNGNMMKPAATAGTVEIHEPWSRASAGMARAAAPSWFSRTRATKIAP